jgi:hypothetical protein
MKLVESNILPEKRTAFLALEFVFLCEYCEAIRKVRTVGMPQVQAQCLNYKKLQKFSNQSKREK